MEANDDKIQDLEIQFHVRVEVKRIHIGCIAYISFKYIHICYYLPPP